MKIKNKNIEEITVAGNIPTIPTKIPIKKFKYCKKCDTVYFDQCKCKKDKE